MPSRGEAGWQGGSRIAALPTLAPPTVAGPGCLVETCHSLTGTGWVLALGVQQAAVGQGSAGGQLMNRGKDEPTSG